MKKIDVNDNYNKNGTMKSLRQIHTHNRILFQENGLDKYLHPVLSKMGTKPNAYKHITSAVTARFVNTAEGIDFVFDALSDARSPMLSSKLKLKGVDYSIMHPYLVAVLDNFSKAKTRITIADGSYTLNRHGGVDYALKNSGIIAIQGAKAENCDDDFKRLFRK